MDMQELKQLIYRGEKADVECKKEESNVPRSVYESYSAFANTKGGYIILGVEENKKKNGGTIYHSRDRKSVQTTGRFIEGTLRVIKNS